MVSAQVARGERPRRFSKIVVHLWLFFANLFFSKLKEHTCHNKNKQVSRDNKFLSHSGCSISSIPLVVPFPASFSCKRVCRRFLTTKIETNKIERKNASYAPASSSLGRHERRLGFPHQRRLLPVPLPHCHCRSACGGGGPPSPPSTSSLLPLSSPLLPIAANRAPICAPWRCWRSCSSWCCHLRRWSP
jgi:hypothetical protein